jgi:hypothetical protein
VGWCYIIRSVGSWKAGSLLGRSVLVLKYVGGFFFGGTDA